MVVHTPRHRATIRWLNDRLRCEAKGNGSLVITSGIDAQGKMFMLRALKAVATFDAFTPDNDPHGEHDFGSFDLDGQRLFWKIDYYNPDLTGGSPDPADEAQTHRVLTIMLASEY